MSYIESESETTPKPNRNPVVLVGGLLLLIAALGLFYFSATQSEPAVEEAAAEIIANPIYPESGPPLREGATAYDFALQDLEGNTVRLSDFHGQPVIVNFWATWCGPCRIEMPALQATYEQHKDDGLVLLALNQDESAEQATAYFDELGLTFPGLLDVERATATNWGETRSLPTTFFIDAEGTVTGLHRGPLVQSQLDEFLSVLLPQ